MGVQFPTSILPPAEAGFFCNGQIGAALVPCFEVFINPDPNTDPALWEVSLRAFRYRTGGDIVTVNNVPEPAVGLLLALGTAFAARRLRRR